MEGALQKRQKVSFKIGLKLIRIERKVVTKDGLFKACLEQKTPEIP